MPDVHTLISGVFLLLAAAALFSVDFQSIAAAITVTTTTETLAAVGFPLSLPSGNGKAVVEVFYQVTVPASTTAIVCKVYAGNAIAGSPVGTFTNVPASNSGSPQYTFSHSLSQTLSMATQAQYCFSLTFSGASGNATISSASIQTELLSG